ncbi:MAG: hypothetical protein CMM59_22305 [Rhodospirillaceae bacterium]|nr:hypothetical protein [Rhodospirillaceae bacterium]
MVFLPVDEEYPTNLRREVALQVSRRNVIMMRKWEAKYNKKINKNRNLIENTHLSRVSCSQSANTCAVDGFEAAAPQ